MTKDSVVDCGIIATVNREMLGSRIGRLPAEQMRAVDSALKISLDLD